MKNASLLTQLGNIVCTILALIALLYVAMVVYADGLLIYEILVKNSEITNISSLALYIAMNSIMIVILQLILAASQAYEKETVSKEDTQVAEPKAEDQS